ncbi:homoserine O-succinyltransferase, partial [Xanthomonas oryzae pv. oryzae]
MSLVNTASPSINDPIDTPTVIDDDITAVRGERVIALPMRHAGMRELRLRYELIGAANAPVVFVAGGISAHRHLAASNLFPEKGWVDGLVGSGRALDPASRRLLA